MVGVSQADGFPGSAGLFTALNVTDARIQRGTDHYLASRVLAKSCDRNYHFSLGWAEVGWRDDRQYVYTYDTSNRQWTFYDQYPISPGQRIWVEIYREAHGEWVALLWWNGGWQLLKKVNPGPNVDCMVEDMVDPYHGPHVSSPDPFTFDSFELGDSTPGGLQIADYGTGQFKTWDTSVPSTRFDDDGSGTYRAKWEAHYWDAEITSTNRPPTVWLGMNRTSGDRSTVFEATIYVDDPNGAPTRGHRVDWGDGTSTHTSEGATVTHKYSAAGSYTVRGYGCDELDACTYSSGQTVVVGASNSPPTAALSVSPSSGNRETWFRADVSGTDPEGDALSYRIEWGDGAVTYGQYGWHRYTTAGTYTVTGTVTDSFGATSSQSKTVTVAFSNRPPSASIDVSPNTGDTSTSFSATVSGTDHEGDPLTFAIDWGDGTVTNGRTGTHRYDSPGRYVVAGIVSDTYGSTSNAFEEVEVCTALVNGTCVQPPADPCGDHGLACGDKPTHVEYPQELRDLMQEQEVPFSFSPDGSVLTLSANVQQVYANANDRCSDPNPEKDCDEAAREQRFAERVLTLSQKERGTDDGMGAVPDLLLLQEVRLGDVNNIIAALDDRGLSYAIGSARTRGSYEVGDREAGINKACNRDFENDRQRQLCKQLTYMHAETAVLYNTLTMKLGDSDFFDSKYPFRHHRPCPNTSDRMIAPRIAVTDEDKDTKDDCRVKWLRQYSASFTKFDVDDNGLPTLTESPLVVAAASIHLITRSHFNPDFDYHERHKRRVAAELADHLKEKYGPTTPRILGGDWNIHRCENKNRQAEGDYPENEGCDTYDWWTHLTDQSGRKYDDAVHAVHASDDDRLVDQYLDGCETINEDGTCSVVNYRKQRIDYVLDRGGDVTDSSFDLTCGQIDSEDFEPNCGDLLNSQRYSDHRLLWGIFEFGVET